MQPPTLERREDPPMNDHTVTGVRMIDGAPYFADHEGVPMNRKQWLGATRPARKAAFIEALLDTPEDALDDTPEEIA